MKVKELIERLNDVNPEAEVITAVWNGFTETYAVIDVVLNDLKYDNIYSELLGTPGRTDGRFFSHSKPMEDTVYLGSKFPFVEEGTRRKKTKVAFNDTYNTDIRLSAKAENWLRKHGYNGPLYNGDKLAIPRHNNLLVKCIETLGEEVNGECIMKGKNVRTDTFGTHLRIWSIKGNAYHIEDIDGMEKVIGLYDMIIARPKC